MEILQALQIQNLEVGKRIKVLILVMITLQSKLLPIGGAAKVDQVEAGAIKMLQPLSLRFSQLAKEMQVPGM